ncbi:DUF6526 family protein [Acidipila sp. EB88]|uniref:DUF6526 family protein n=1 Tax=Acidipila sp. EB88 TaxID=2305226 RepID=UPI000F5F750F|nr:DUF6526 family protein [Acidipila sp. EB88]RRA49176.1 hypothetical protein D1Y84_13755 [Acidipila sp. EB88]
MAEQNFKNHARTDPMYHYVLAPLFLVNLVVAMVRCVHHPSAWHGWALVVALGLLLLVAMVRQYSLRVQDRVIRLEERIRMAALLPMESRALQGELTQKQIVALRFASDAELSDLAHRAVRERMTPKAIKQAVQSWRPDYHRV